MRFDQRLSDKLKLKPDQALHVYYAEAGGRRILLSLLPKQHAEEVLAEPSINFENAGGRVYVD